MKNLLCAAAIAITGTMLLLAPAQSANQGSHIGYCRSNIADPLCMDSKTFKMRKMMMAMTKEKAMANRSKYCRNNISDAICTKKMMNSTLGF